MKEYSTTERKSGRRMRKRKKRETEDTGVTGDCTP